MDAAREALGKTGLGPLEKKSARSLSGGQQQRLAIARALAGQPRVLVLDEPTNSLDSDGQIQLFALLKTLQADQRIMIVMVSHDVAELKRHADEIIVLNKSLRWRGDRAQFDESMAIM